MLVVRLRLELGLAWSVYDVVSLRGHLQPVYSIYTDLSANEHELNLGQHN
ncbi:hypothetical protein [Shewanella hafniensis]|nr:hypothetical protein [Shewanella hafniensis]MCL1133557.1 hypothetical protein [Shewanella hafniensis]